MYLVFFIFLSHIFLSGWFRWPKRRPKPEQQTMRGLAPVQIFGGST
jgi:uncharacterized iron-regulated membrane protein